jgi:hypothetical protein
MLSLVPKEFKIRFNTDHKETPGLCWKVIIDGEEILVSDVSVEGVRVFTTSHFLPSGEQKWSIGCHAQNYRIDENRKIHIYNS